MPARTNIASLRETHIAIPTRLRRLGISDRERKAESSVRIPKAGKPSTTWSRRGFVELPGSLSRVNTQPGVLKVASRVDAFDTAKEDELFDPKPVSLSSSGAIVFETNDGADLIDKFGGFMGNTSALVYPGTQRGQVLILLTRVLEST